MYQIEILPGQSATAHAYEGFLQKKFSSLKDNRNPIDVHIVVKSGDEWIAGASLVHQSLLENDPDITDLWSVNRITNCCRILRLWSLRSTAVPRLLRAIEKQIPPDHFVYGILSVSQRFAIENSLLFQTDLQIVKPRYQVADIKFDNEDFATSEGQRLIQIYKQFNAEFLGPIAASPEDQTVRALMGISMAQKAEPQFWKRYEETL